NILIGGCDLPVDVFGAVDDADGHAAARRVLEQEPVPVGQAVLVNRPAEDILVDAGEPIGRPAAVVAEVLVGGNDVDQQPLGIDAAGQPGIDSPVLRLA